MSDTITAAPADEAPAALTFRKEIKFDRETKDFALYLDGELAGFARTYQEAEVALDQMVFDLLQGLYAQEAM